MKVSFQRHHYTHSFAIHPNLSFFDSLIGNSAHLRLTQMLLLLMDLLLLELLLLVDLLLLELLLLLLLYVF